MTGQKPENKDNVTPIKEDDTSQKVKSALIALTDFASSENGAKLIGMMMNNSKSKHRLEYIPRYFLAGSAVVGACTLSYFGKFDPSIAVLLGSVVGYMFGKNSD